MIPIIALISVAFASNAIIASAQDGSICPSELAFVCGVDGKNYSNECVAIGNGQGFRNNNGTFHIWPYHLWIGYY